MNTDGGETQGEKSPRLFALSAPGRLVFLSVFIRVYPCLNFFLFGGFGTEFQDFPRLAAERFADRLERGEADGLGLAGLEDGQILRRDVHGLGQIVQPHFALRENHVEINDDGHG